jgi:hypothetical protein
MATGTPPSPQLKAVVDRLTRLEEQHRRLQRLSAGLFGIAVLLTVVLAVVLFIRTRPRTALEARQLVLRDEEGRARVVLGAGEAGGVRLTFQDDQEKGRLELALDGGGPAVTLRDEQGRARALLASRAGGAVNLTFQDDREKGRLELALQKNGPRMSVYDDNLRGGALFSVDDNVPGLNFFDRNGQWRGRFSLHGNQPGLALLDERQEPRMELTVGAEGPKFSLLEGADKPRLEMTVPPAGPDGGPRFALLDGDQVPRAVLAFESRDPGLHLFDEAGMWRGWFGLNNDNPELAFNDQEETARARLRVEASGATFDL